VNHDLISAGNDPAPVRENLSGTVVDALGLLDVLVAEPRGIGLTEAARRAGLNKATAFRHLAALRRAELAILDPATGRYRPGLKLVRMADQLLEAFDLRTVAHPYVERLAREAGVSVLAGVLEGAEVVYVDYAEGGGELRVHRRIGGRRSVHLSSIGKAIVAHLPSEDLAAVLDRCTFERRTEHTIVDPAAFVGGLEDVRRRGWALVRDEDVLGASSVSAPVFDRTGRVAGAIGMAASSFTLRDETLDRFVRLLSDACRAVSEGLGWVCGDRTVSAAG
jgi:IclR family KDG regulon transcriptional repressor